jgi:hypothetical protein
VYIKGAINLRPDRTVSPHEVSGKLPNGG